MSSPATNLNNFIAKGFNDIFGASVDATKDINHDDPKLIQFNRFLDSVIKIGTESHGLSKGQVISRASNFLNTQLAPKKDNLEKALLLNTLTQALKEKHDEHVGNINHSLSAKLLQSTKDLGLLTSLMDETLKPDVVAKKEYADASKEDVQEVFAFHMQAIGKELTELPENERKSVFKDKLIALTKNLELDYGSQKIQAFSDSVKDSQLASYTYLVEDRTGAKLFDYSLSEDAMLVLMEADFSQMSQEDKLEVSELIQSFFSNLNENGVFPEEKKLDFDIAFSKLKPEQQAYYQNAKNQASEISEITSNPAELLGKLAKKLPGSIIPGIIGAIVGYMMGFGFIGGAAGIAMAALGDKVEAEEDGKFDSEAKVELPKPPSFRRTALETQAAA